MEQIIQHLPTLMASAGALGFALPAIRQRLALSRAKYRSLAGHSKWSKRIAKLLPYYDYSDDTFFRCDGADAVLANKRRDAFFALAHRLQTTAPLTIAQAAQTESAISDMQFTSRYKVPFQFSRLVKQHLKTGSFFKASQGVMLTDLDGNTFYDLTGSYGVNVWGYDFYKRCMQTAETKAGELGPVLGSYHPCMTETVQALREVSGLDEVSFHMSGTEAVMQAVRLARYHTGKRYTVRFCGAYHGWWGDVQPGIGNPATAHDTLTLSDMSEKTLAVLRSRRDIACVLVNPLQALHPNQNAPSDNTLVNSKRRAGFDKKAYTEWLQALRKVCDETGIVLIFDEVFVGFRLAYRGAQDYFNTKADMVTYGKTLGGGFPVGVLCGKASLMKRYRDDKPVDVCFARGTFNSHPYVVAAMHTFLQAMASPDYQAQYESLDDRWNRYAALFNKAFETNCLPIRVANLSSIWTLYYTSPSRYNWLLQYYLRAEGIALSWVGTGRIVFSLNYTEEGVLAVLNRFMAAAHAMKRDGWWSSQGLDDAGIQKQVMKEMLSAAVLGKTTI